jgi:hypothetical protein
MKLLFSIFLAVLFVLGGNAQITTYWTSNIPLKNRPAASAIPVDTLLDGYTTSRQAFQVDVAGTLDNANQATAFAAIGAAVKTAIDTNYIEDVWGLDESADILGRILITDIRRRSPEYEPGDIKNQYLVATDVFRVSGFFEWAIEAP